MAKILLNHRPSRITLVGGILLLPAEVVADEVRGNVTTPSRTLISERGNPSPFERVTQDPGTQKLFTAGILAWSNEVVDEPGGEDDKPAGATEEPAPKAPPPAPPQRGPSIKKAGALKNAEL